MTALRGGQGASPGNHAVADDALIELCQSLEIVGAGGVIDIRQFCRAGRFVALEQFSVMALGDIHMAEQVVCKRGAILVAEEVCKTLDVLGLLGQRVGLFVGDHL